MQQLLQQTQSYTLLKTEGAEGRLSHAYLLHFADAENLRLALKEFAKILQAQNPQKEVEYVGGKINDITDIILGEIQKNDVVITLGAGDITKLGYALASKIRG